MIRIDAEPADGSLLRIERAVKRYGDVCVLDDITLNVDQGTFVVLLGPSGSGKTTLLRCVAGIERISEGTIRLAGRIVDNGRRQAPPERRDLAMVFQDYALWPHMTVYQNVAFALRRSPVEPAAATRRVRQMLERVGLGGKTERFPSELSGGEQQRVALARALVGEPRLLLFDEPLSNLDANLREQMRAEIATLVREVHATALYITHDQAEAFALADRIGVLQRGKLVQLATPEAVYATPSSPFVARLTGLAGELAGTVAGDAGDGLMRVDVGGATLEARAGENLPPHAPARLLIRPAAVQLTTAAAPSVPLRAVVRDVAFVGRGYEHVVELEAGGRLTGIFAERRFGRGEQVAMRLDPWRCLLFRAEPATMGEP